MPLIQFMLQNVALDSKINLVKVEAENTGIACATASISNEQIDQINRKICGILKLKLYKIIGVVNSLPYLSH